MPLMLFYIHGGASKYRRVAEAVRNSGARVFVNLDSSGIVSPVTSALFYRTVLGIAIRSYGAILGIPLGMLRNLIFRFYVPFFVEPGRVVHLKSATAIGCISPSALTMWRCWARTYAPELVERMYLVPHPTTDDLMYDASIEKRDMVIAIGRWNDTEQKRPNFLAQTIEKAANLRGKTEFHIFGNPGPVLPVWYARLAMPIRNRIFIHGKVPHPVIANALLQSRVSLCSSSHESTHIVSEEALCAGASVVAPCRAELSSMLWFTSHGSGRLAVEDTPNGLAETLLLELDAWDRGERNPEEISSFWHSFVSASAVANKIRCLLEERESKT